jgi:rare lipoprotein A
MPRLAPAFPLAAICACVIVVANAAASPSMEEGLASVYGEQFNGKSTASGERYDGGMLTAAHRTLPLGTEVKVTNISNGKTVRVRINDRGLHVQGRIIDFSSSAAAALGLATGVARVKLEILGQPAQAGGPRPSRP